MNTIMGMAGAMRDTFVHSSADATAESGRKRKDEDSNSPAKAGNERKQKARFLSFRRRPLERRTG